MSKIFEIIIPTQLSEDEFAKTSAFECVSSICKSTMIENPEFQCFYKIFYNNLTGLSELFQSVLDKTTSDYVIFMHDDLEIHDHFIFKKLIKAHDDFDIVGLAGATSQDYSQNVPMVWHLSKQHSSDARGIVGHYIPKGFDGARETHVNSVYFGPSPSRVVVIDGLFMSFKIESLKDKPELFDKTFTFHHYDMAMSANASLNNLTMGVYPVYCVHHGLGEFANDKVWKTHSQEFKLKYNNYKIKV